MMVKLNGSQSFGDWVTEESFQTPTLKTRYTIRPLCTEALPSTTDSDGFATLLLDSEMGSKGRYLRA